MALKFRTFLDYSRIFHFRRDLILRHSGLYAMQCACALMKIKPKRKFLRLRYQQRNFCIPEMGQMGGGGGGGGGGGIREWITVKPLIKDTPKED